MRTVRGIRFQGGFDRRLRLTKEGVGETSGETAGPISREPALDEAVGQKGQALFVVAGISPQFHRPLASAGCAGGISDLACSPTPSVFERPPCVRPLSFSAPGRIAPESPPRLHLDCRAGRRPVSAVAGNGYRLAKGQGESIFHDCRKPLRNGHFCRSRLRVRAPRSPSIQRDA